MSAVTSATRGKAQTSLKSEGHNEATPKISAQQTSLQTVQSAAGNLAVQRLFTNQGITLQPKLSVGAADSEYEQEADRAAEQVTSMITPPSALTGQATVQEHVGGDEVAQMKPLASTITSLVQRAPSEPSGSFEPGADFAARLSASSGSPLPLNTRAFMEPRFGADFSGVRLHTGSEAAQLNRAVGAQAFTHGRDIYLGKSNLESSAGKHLLAHELTHTIQQGAAVTNAPTVQRLHLPGNDGGLIQRQPAPNASEPSASFNVPTLDQLYNQAVQNGRQTGDWQDAAEKLNGFNYLDIQSRLAQLTAEEVGYLHLGALDNPRVGSQSQVAQLTRPGSPRASIVPSTSRQPPLRPAMPISAPALTATNRSIADMTSYEKLIEAYNRARITAAVWEKILSLITPQALVLAILSFATVFVLSQFTPVGWAADIGLILTAIFVSTALFTAIQHLINFADARNATTSEQLDQAGAEFAQAIAEIEVDAIIFLVTHSAGGRPRGGAPYEGPPPPGFRLALAEGEIIVPVAANTISVAEAAQLGIRGAPALTPLMSRGSGSGSGSRRRDFEPPVRDATGRIHSRPGEDIPRTPAERETAVRSWSREELEVAAEELRGSIAARNAQQLELGETSLGAEGQRVGAAHRVRIGDEEDLLRRVLKRLSGS